MTYIYNLYSSNQLGLTKSYHIQTDLPPHKFRAVMKEFRNGGEKDPKEFVNYMSDQFPDSFKLFEFDDIVQFDADQENSVILANLLDQNNQTI